MVNAMNSANFWAHKEIIANILFFCQFYFMDSRAIPGWCCGSRSGVQNKNHCQQWPHRYHRRLFYDRQSIYFIYHIAKWRGDLEIGRHSGHYLVILGRGRRRIVLS